MEVFDMLMVLIQPVNTHTVAADQQLKHNQSRLNHGTYTFY